jgi:hypothetical protein
MKKNIVFPVLLLLCHFQLLAQNPSLAWAKSLKTQVMAGNQIINSPSAVVTDASGNVYMTGSFTGTSDFDPGAATVNLTSVGGRDIFITKFDIAGNYIWAKRMGSTGEDVGLSIAVDAAGGVYVTGYYQGTVDFDPGTGTTNLGGSGLNNAFIAKYSSDGSFAWADAIIGSDAYSAGIALDASNNVYVTGYYQGTTDFDPSANVANLTNAGLFDIFLAKYSATGAYTWAKSMGGNGYEQGNGLAVDASSNVYITGYFGSAVVDFDPSANTANLTKQGGNDMFIAKYDASGNYVWANDIGGAAGNVNVRSITLDASANIHVAGTVTGTTDFDPTASVANLSGTSSSDIFFAKYTSAGTYTWAKSLAGSGPDECYSIALDASGNVYITGYIGGATDFDPSAATANLFPSSFDIYMAKYSSLGSYLWARSFGSNANSNSGFAVAVDALGYLLLAGSFTNSIDFDPTAGSTVLTTNQVNTLYNGDVFLAKYNTGSSLPLASNSFTAKPNGIGATIEWTTINEQLNEHFVVERSDDVNQFYAIKTITGKGNSSHQNAYLVIDNLPIKKIAYYRLKQISADGRSSYSKTISLKMGGDMQVDIYPNPATNTLNIQINSLLYKTLHLLNEEGKLLITKPVAANMQLDISTLPAGTYHVQLVGNNGNLSRTIIKN